MPWSATRVSHAPRPEHIDHRETHRLPACPDCGELTHSVKPSDEYGMKLSRLHARIVDLSTGDWANAHAQRLAKRLHRYGEELLTFVEFEGCRRAIITRSGRYGRRS